MTIYSRLSKNHVTRAVSRIYYTAKVLIVFFFIIHQFTRVLSISFLILPTSPDATVARATEKYDVKCVYVLL